jgi:dihydroorotate dehydrogenase
VIQVTTLKGEDPIRVLPGLVEWGFEMGADRVEINGSCPNLDPKHPLLCVDVDQVYALFDAVHAHVGPEREVGFKVSPMPQDIIRRYRSERRLQVAHMGVINTKGNQQSPMNPATDRPFIEVNDGLAGMSGPIIHDLSIDNLRMWTEPFDGGGTYEIWSVGGVLDEADKDLRLDMGAKLVGMAQEPYRASRTTGPFQRIA